MPRENATDKGSCAYPEEEQQFQAMAAMECHQHPKIRCCFVDLCCFLGGCTYIKE